MSITITPYRHDGRGRQEDGSFMNAEGRFVEWSNECSVFDCFIGGYVGGDTHKFVWDGSVLNVLVQKIHHEGYASGEYKYWQAKDTIKAASLAAAVLAYARKNSLQRKFGLEITLEWIEELVTGKAKFPAMYRI